MSLSDADHTPDTFSSSFGDSDESQEARGLARSYFLEDFNDTFSVAPRIPGTTGGSDGRRSSGDSSVRTVATAVLLEGSNSSGDNGYSTANEREPNIEDAVRYLRREVAATVPRLSYGIASTDCGFEAHEYNLPRKVSESSSEPETAGRSKAPHSPSLLSNILVPSPQKTCPRTIPVLRAVSGSHIIHPQTWEPKKRSIAPVAKVQQTVLAPPERARIAKMTESQMDLTLSTLQEYQKDLEATAGRGINTENSGMPIQHIDSTSIRSFDSQEHKFYDIYSMTRILTVITVCLVVPPLFFMIAAGEQGGGVSNYRLMRLIMNSNHRAGLMKGFIWDVDVHWFRYLCLSLGIVETMCIMVGIGCGIGIGRRRERH